MIPQTLFATARKCTQRHGNAVMLVLLGAVGGLVLGSLLARSQQAAGG